MKIKRLVIIAFISIAAISVLLFLSNSNKVINALISAQIQKEDTIMINKWINEQSTVIMTINLNDKNISNVNTQKFADLINERFTQKVKVKNIEVREGWIILHYEDGLQVYWNQIDKSGFGSIDF